jgi:F0F1-type ATP synthase alpha subunit
MDARLQEIALIRKSLLEEKRLPRFDEFGKIASFNQELCTSASRLVEQGAQANRPLTELEQGQVCLKYIQMLETPEKFILNNRFLERVIDPEPQRVSAEAQTELQKKQARVVQLLKKTEGGYVPEELELLQQHKLEGSRLRKCERHGQWGCLRKACKPEEAKFDPSRLLMVDGRIIAPSVQ